MSWKAPLSYPQIFTWAIGSRILSMCIGDDSLIGLRNDQPPFWQKMYNLYWIHLHYEKHKSFNPRSIGLKRKTLSTRTISRLAKWSTSLRSACKYNWYTKLQEKFKAQELRHWLTWAWRWAIEHGKSGHSLPCTFCLEVRTTNIKKA